MGVNESAPAAKGHERECPPVVLTLGEAAVLVHSASDIIAHYGARMAPTKRADLESAMTKLLACDADVLGYAL